MVLDFQFTPEQEAFREEVKDFISKELPASILSGEPHAADDHFEETMEFRRKLGQRKWIGIGWPVEYGGLGADALMQSIFHYEMLYHNAPLDNQAYQVGPAIIGFGSDYLKKKFLTATANQEIVWCQGFSEPDAGSDLANVQTSAVRDGDDYIVNGQKTWTSLGHRADWVHVLTRTDPDSPKHKGISYFVMDMRSPGITVRPLVNMVDNLEFNEVFFKDVRVPAVNMIGEENMGWYVAMTTLDNERSGIRDVANCQKQFDHLLAALRQGEGIAGVRRDRGAVHRLAELAIEIQVVRQLAYRISWMQTQGIKATREPAIAKMFGTDLEQRITQVGMALLGLYGPLRMHSKRELVHGNVVEEYLHTVSTTISAGSNEIQRNIIATRGLGLPRG